MLASYMLFFSKKVNWFGARDHCQQMGMKMATLKTLSQVEAVGRELKILGFSKKLSIIGPIYEI